MSGPVFPGARRGYDPRDVDAFIDRLAAHVEAGQDPAALVARAQFGLVRHGYDERSVDDWLDAVIDNPSLAMGAGAPSPEAQLDDAGPAEDAPPDQLPSPITEPKAGLLRRLLGS